MSYYFSFSMALFLSLVAFAALLPSPTLSTSSLATTVTGKDGEFYAHLLIGTPPTPENLILDTDSDLIWIDRCNKASSHSYATLGCSTDLCKKPNMSCNKSNSVCQYKYQSTNLSTFQVDLATETFTFVGGSTVSKLVFSCGALEAETGGGLGLGSGPPSLVSQTNATVFSYCLPEYDELDTKGFLSVGTSLAKSHDPNMMISTRLVNNHHKPSRYYMSVEGISVNKVRLAIPTSAFEIDEENGAGGIIIDVGSTVSYFDERVYAPLVNEIRKTIRLKPATSPKDVDLRSCFSIPPSNSYKLPRITLHFNSSSRLTLSAANTFRTYTDPKTNRNISCLAIEKAPDDDNGMSRFGNIQQLNTVVFVDLANQKVGFLPITRCDAMSKH